MSSLADGVVVKESKKPKYSRFTQQELPACKPLLTPAWVISTFFVVGVIFIPIGAASLAASNGVVEIVKRYDDLCLPNMSNDQRDALIRRQGDGISNTSCTITITVDKTMQPPIYFYYQIDNFYQNHRRYVKSRSDSQLSGTNVSLATLTSSCQPEDYLGGNTSMPINPCGLVAWSLFNDTYSVSAQGAPVAVNESGIAWQSDIDTKFGAQLPQSFNTIAGLRGGATLPPNQGLNKDEHLMVWMRTAALPKFRKLWGRITEPLTAGTILTLTVNNVYNTYAFSGQKAIVLSTTSWLGGKNEFLGIAYLSVGGLCILLALMFFALQIISPRPLGDTSYLSWNRKAMAAAGNH